MKKILFAFVALAWAHSGASPAVAEEPVVTDSRVKTYVYNEYDVYSVYTHYGYQSNIEFGRGEEIETVSVGDRIGWQIVPVGRRLFIRPMEENVSTNMTVVTNKHSYQFDLSSSGGGKLRPSEKLAYVVRFYYPEEHEMLNMAVPMYATVPSPKYNAPTAYAAAPVYAQPAPTMQPIAAQPAPPPRPPSSLPLLPSAAATTRQAAPASALAVGHERSGYVYDKYRFVGPQTLTPLRVFDNGRETFFHLRPLGKVRPRFYVLGKDGREYPVAVRNMGRGVLAANVVAGQFVVHYGAKGSVAIYREGA